MFCGIIEVVRNEVLSMSMTRRGTNKDFGFIIGTMEEFVPEDHLVRKMEEALNWDFIYPLVKPLYSLYGRPSIDPVLFKMIFINYSFGIHSMRKTCEEIRVNLAYRWFLGIRLDEPVPNYSTWSQNYIRRYGDSDVFERIFERIIQQGLRYDFIHTDTVFADSTHQKASANKRKHERKQVELTKKKYEDELLEEINEDRISHLLQIRMQATTTKGSTKNVSPTAIRPSVIPMASSCAMSPCQATFMILYLSLMPMRSPGNVHDSVSFFDAYEILNERYKVKNIVLDAGYKTPAIAKEVSDHEQILYLPYTRPKGQRRETFSKKEFTYDKDNDIYLCPNDQALRYSTTDKRGYRIYKSDPSKCISCPFLEKCTSSKNHQKSLAVHIWQEYLDECEQRRHTEEWKKIYPLRKETIERGLKKNSHQAAIIFSVHNLKKLSLWRSKNKAYYDHIDEKEAERKKRSSNTASFS